MKELSQFLHRLNQTNNTINARLLAFTTWLDKVNQRVLAFNAWIDDARAVTADNLSLLNDITPIFIEAGFWFTQSTSFLLKARVVVLAKEGKLTPESLTHTILDWYRMEDYTMLERMVASWQKNMHFAPCMHILDEAVDVHKQGKYAVSIPPLLAQVEGIAIKIADQYNIEPNKKNHPRVKAVLAFVVNGAFLAVNRDALRHAIDDTIYRGGFDVHQLESALASLNRDPEQFLNRHAILHGGHLHYNIEANSLRAFLLLDALAHPYIESTGDGSEVSVDPGVFRTFFEDILLPDADSDEDETNDAAGDDTIEGDKHDEEPKL